MASDQRIDHFFSMPAARADRWRDLVAAARSWASGKPARFAFMSQSATSKAAMACVDSPLRPTEAPAHSSLV